MQLSKFIAILNQFAEGLGDVDPKVRLRIAGDEEYWAEDNAHAAELIGELLEVESDKNFILSPYGPEPELIILGDLNEN